MDEKNALIPITVDMADDQGPKICLITKQPCSFQQCLLWMEMSDWEGCTFDMASDGLKRGFTKVATKADDMMDLLEEILGIVE